MSIIDIPSERRQRPTLDAMCWRGGEYLTAAWRVWRRKRAALKLLERAELYEATQPSFAQDMRAAANLALGNAPGDGDVLAKGASRALRESFAGHQSVRQMAPLAGVGSSNMPLYDCLLRD